MFQDVLFLRNGLTKLWNLAVNYFVNSWDSRCVPPRLSCPVVCILILFIGLSVDSRMSLPVSCCILALILRSGCSCSS